MEDKANIRTQHLIWAIAVDVLALWILTLGLLVIEYWQDWLLVPINALPTTSWILYAMMCISWLLLPVLLVLVPGSVEGKAHNDGAPAKHSSSLVSWLLVLISFVFFPNVSNTGYNVGWRSITVHKFRGAFCITSNALFWNTLFCKTKAQISINCSATYLQVIVSAARCRNYVCMCCKSVTCVLQ